jgi:RNase P subunit RPR2
MLTTIEQQQRFFCPACQKWVMHQMTDVTVDVDQQTSDGIPFMVGYKCDGCGRTKRDYGNLQTFTIRGEMKEAE